MTKGTKGARRGGKHNLNFEDHVVVVFFVFDRQSISQNKC